MFYFEKKNKKEIFYLFSALSFSFSESYCFVSSRGRRIKKDLLFSAVIKTEPKTAGARRVFGDGRWGVREGEKRRKRRGPRERENGWGAGVDGNKPLAL